VSCATACICVQQVDDLRAGQPVDDGTTLAPRLHQPGLLELLQMLRHVGDGQVHGARERIDRALGLGQEFQQLQPLAVRHGASDARELFEQRRFDGGGCDPVWTV
jgi:hypothetical protein